MFGFNPNEEKPFDANWVSPDTEEALLGQRRLISVVGLTAILLPPTVILVDQYSELPCFRDSLSHYYYSQRSGVVFVMTLAFIGTLLSAYRAEAPFVRWLALVAGMAGLIVAVFPTEGAGCELAAFNARLFGTVQDRVPAVDFETGFILFAGVGIIHYAAAAVMFGLMFYFCAVVFRRPGENDTKSDGIQKTDIKKFRNTIYAGCAIVIALAMIVMALSWVPRIGALLPQRIVLIGEWVALWAFGTAWLVKGRLFGTSLGA